jgi:phosphoglycerate kinase
MGHRSVRNLDARGKTVFCRVDFNVPLDGTSIADDRRIRAALPTLQLLADSGARVACASHLGRPKGQRRPELSLAPVARRLSELLGREVPFAADCLGEPAAELVRGLDKGGVGLLENLRFHEGETSGDRELARRMAQPFDLYVNDAFGAAHRAHASVVGVPEALGNAAAGLLMDREMEALGRLLHSPERPYAAILGGAKVSDKIPLLKKLLERVDHVLIGGAMAYTFLASRGIGVGASRVERDRIDLAREIDARAKTAGVKLHLPEDHVTASSLDGLSPRGLETAGGEEISAGRIGLDIGPRTIESWRSLLSEELKTVLWNGPLGLFEASGCDSGTKSIAQHLAAIPAFRVLGGGDTAAAAARFGLDNAYDHVSTGGGAALEFLSGIALPGVEALDRFGS